MISENHHPDYRNFSFLFFKKVEIFPQALSALATTYLFTLLSRHQIIKVKIVNYCDAHRDIEVSFPFDEDLSCTHDNFLND